MSASEVKHFWIYKGSSNFCSELGEYDLKKDDFDETLRKKPDGFYDIVSLADTIDGGLHVVEYSAYEKLEAEANKLRQDLASAKEQIG